MSATPAKVKTPKANKEPKAKRNPKNHAEVVNMQEELARVRAWLTSSSPLRLDGADVHMKLTSLEPVHSDHPVFAGLVNQKHSPDVVYHMERVLKDAQSGEQVITALNWGMFLTRCGRNYSVFYVRYNNVDMKLAKAVEVVCITHKRF